MATAHQHADIELNFLFSGGMQYFIAGRRVAVPRRTLTVLWGGTPHALIDAERGSECAWTTIPLTWFLGWGLPRTLVRRLLGGELLMDSSSDRAARDELEQREWASFAISQLDEHRRIVRLEVEARVRRLALAVVDVVASPGGAADSSSAGLAERIAALIGARYTERLTIETIASAVGSNPNHIMRVFRRTCGMSIGDYLTGLRVSQAQRLLIETDSKILDVALRSGFGSSSRFYDAFTKAVGQTPSAYREGLLQPAAADPLGTSA